jgi:hypothetical protein
MNPRVIVGEYLGKPIGVLDATSLNIELQNHSLRRALTLVCFEERSSFGMKENDILWRLIRECPIGISVAGASSERLFGELLVLLSKDVGCPHIMTKRGAGMDMREWIWDLISATWPDSARFPEWKEYAIIAVGEGDYWRNLVDSARGVLGEGDQA